MQYVYIISHLHILFQLTTIYSIFKKFIFGTFIFDMIWYDYYLLMTLYLTVVTTTILKTITIKHPWILKLPASHNYNTINNPEACPEEDKHTTRLPERNLEGGAFMCYVITQLQAYKADNSELINCRVPGAALLTSRCLRQGHNAEVTSPLSNSEKPEIVIFCFRHSFAVNQ